MPLFAKPDSKEYPAIGRLGRTIDGQLQVKFLAAELDETKRLLIHGPMDKVPELRGRAQFIEDFLKLLQDAQQAL